MATSYPASLPAPLVNGFSGSVDMGVIRSDMPMIQAQRRVYATMPHRFTLAFMLDVTTWAAWYSWVSANGFRWFLINLPTFYAGQSGAALSSVLIRFTSGFSAQNVSQDTVKVTISAEIAPSMIGAYLAAT